MMAFRLTLLLLLAVGGGLGYWTQTLARTYGYHPALGPALWEFKPWPGSVYQIYAPWQALVWQWQWGSATLTWVVLGGASVALALTGLAWWGWQGRGSQPPPLEGHGTTKWATRQDVKKAGLL